MAGFQGLFGTVTARMQRIVNFDSFILSHVPYGQVDAKKNIQIGLIEYDGPNADLALVTKPLLAWNFGGIAYPVTKAARVEYTYQYGDSTGTPVKASLLLGFQTGLASQSLKASPQVQASPDAALLAAIGRVSNDKLPDAFGLAAAAQANNVVTGSALGFSTLDELIDGELLAELSNADAARAKAAESAFTAWSLQSAAGTATNAAKDARAAVEAHRTIVGGPDIVGQELRATADRLDKDAADAWSDAAYASKSANSDYEDVETAVCAAQYVRDAWVERKKLSMIVAFDGPAQDNNSHNPFGYTAATLFNDREKYAQVLWWYFGGKAYRVTKAIRVPISTPQTTPPTGEDVESLFIGFAGPGGDQGA